MFLFNRILISHFQNEIDGFKPQDNRNFSFKSLQSSDNFGAEVDQSIPQNCSGTEKSDMIDSFISPQYGRINLYLFTC